MDDPERTLPRSLYLSVAIVAAVYIAVTLGAQMLVSDHTIVATKEAAFVAVGERRSAGRPLGRDRRRGVRDRVGDQRHAVLDRAARSATPRATGELPPALGRETNGLPLVAMTFIAIAGAAMAMLPGITSVIVFGSGSFLAVYTIVNYLEARQSPTRSRRLVAWIAAIACVPRWAISSSTWAAMTACCTHPPRRTRLPARTRTHRLRPASSTRQGVSSQESSLTPSRIRHDVPRAACAQRVAPPPAACRDRGRRRDRRHGGARARRAHDVAARHRGLGAPDRQGRLQRVAEGRVRRALQQHLAGRDSTRIRATKGVAGAIGVFVHTGKIDTEHPFFIEIGLRTAGRGRRTA